MKHVLPPDMEVDQLQVAMSVHNSSRAATALSVDDIKRLACALIVYDHELHQSLSRQAQMLSEVSEKEKTKHVSVPIPQTLHDQPDIAKAIVEFVKASDALDDAKFGPDENQARQKFEKAAAALAAKFKPMIRNGVQKK